MMNDYIDMINDADLVLVGVGRELSANALLDYSKEITNPKYQELLGKDDEDAKWMRTIYERNFLLSLDTVDYFRQLEEALEGKNYFVITSNDDGLLFHSKLRKDRITAPCGTGEYFQCSKPCDSQLYPAKPGFQDVISHYETTGEIEHVQCPKCHEDLTLNVRNDETKDIYVEGAYMTSWANYTKWLQGTLYKKIVLLELGEGFDLPSLFRWPFEEIAFYQEKATLIRVHHSLYHLNEEIKEKGVSVPMDAKTFLNRLNTDMKEDNK